MKDENKFLLLLGGAVALWCLLKNKTQAASTSVASPLTQSGFVNNNPIPPGVPGGSTPSGVQTNGVWQFWTDPAGNVYTYDNDMQSYVHLTSGDPNG